jgi:CheY-like chemotaxis protein
VDELKRILAVALDRETLDRLGPVVDRASLAVDCAAQASEATTLANRTKYHLVICRYPLPDIKLREFVAALRASRSSSRTASLMLLTIPEMMTEARSGVGGGACLVFSGQERIGAIGEGAAHLLQVAPRFSPRITVEVRVRIEDEEVFEGWVANLSSSGMLVTDSPMLSVGSTCVFEFSLPNGRPVRGSGVVVRHAAPRREKVTGFAVRFLEFEGDGRRSLAAWCEEDEELPGA